MPIFSDSVLDQPSRFARYRGFLMFAAIFAVLWFVVPPVIRYLPEFLPDPAVLQTETGSIRIVTMTERLNRPWGLAFLPEGDILVTELPGRLRRIHNGKLQGQIIPGVPKVETQDQAGLMDNCDSSTFRRKPSRLPDLFQNRPAGQHACAGSRPL
jgi:hypothetical protein